jgi:type II secretory pathway pseudopilin PulG
MKINKKSFSLIEIVVALGFSAVILTSFITLSAWSLNKTKNNETEDITYQTMIQFNDLLKGSSNNVSIGENGESGQFASIVPSTTSKIYFINTGYGMNEANASSVRCNLKYDNGNYSFPVQGIKATKSDLFATCKNSEELQLKSSDGNNDSGICVFAEIKKLNSIPNDYKYTYTIRALAEKSDGQIFDETIEGLRSAPFIPSLSDHAECN